MFLLEMGYATLPWFPQNIPSNSQFKNKGTKVELNTKVRVRKHNNQNQVSPYMTWTGEVDAICYMPFDIR